MSNRLLLLLAGSFVIGCAPSFPARPELPPISAQVGDAAETPAPVIPKPDLSTVTSELQAVTGPAAQKTRVKR